jgi:hypothetical protein
LLHRQGPELADKRRQARALEELEGDVRPLPFEDRVESSGNDRMIEGAQRALRLRTQGRSTATGPLPGLIARAADFSVEIREGSTVLEFEAPTLREADPEYFAQEDLFPDIAPELTSYDYLAGTLNSALRNPNESVVDMQMVQLLTKYQQIFDRGIEYIEFRPHRDVVSKPLVVRESDLRDLKQLERQIPPPQAVRMAGHLDLIKFSDGTFTIKLPTGEKVRGVTNESQRHRLHELWGSEAMIIGTAFFGPSKRIIRVEAQIVRPATEKDLQLWAIPPEPQLVRMSDTRLKVPQGPRSGINAVIGKWPGDEDDAEIVRALEQLS